MVRRRMIITSSCAPGWDLLLCMGGSNTHLQHYTTRRKWPKRLLWSRSGDACHRPSARKAITGVFTPIDRERSPASIPNHTSRPSSPWSIQMVQRIPIGSQSHTCSEVEQAVSVEERTGEARLMIRGDRSMAKERMYGDVWTRVALVDRLICFASETS